MKIVIVTSPVTTCPPLGPDGKQTYGGLESVSFCRAKGLAELGHEVTLIAARGSKAPKNVELIETVKPSYPRFDMEGKAYQYYKQLLPKFDVGCDDSWAHYAGVLSGEYLPILNIMHSPVTFNRAPNRPYPMVCGVSQAHSLYASKALGVPVRTIYNCVPVEEYPLTEKLPDEPNFLSLNRIAPEKGIDKIVDLLAYSEVGGDIVGDDSMIIQNKDYPLIVKRKCEAYSARSEHKIRYHGLVPQDKKIELMKKSRGLVLMPEGPPTYFEVFGLSAIEMMAIGRPVITNGTGALGEIVEQGVSGYIVSNKDEFKLACRSVLEGRLSPADCRKSAERFSVENMSKVYERILTTVVQGSRW